MKADFLHKITEYLFESRIIRFNARVILLNLKYTRNDTKTLRICDIMCKVSDQVIEGNRQVIVSHISVFPVWLTGLVLLACLRLKWSKTLNATFVVLFFKRTSTGISIIIRPGYIWQAIYTLWRGSGLGNKNP